MSYSPKEQKAIAHHMDQHNCVVQLSVRPKVRFILRGETEHHDLQIHGLVNDYEKFKKEDSAERARKRREEKQMEKLRTPFKDSNY